MKRFCELCKRLARMHCESDQASLCLDCDAKVHSANFLVARHSRNLLCQVCQSPTTWSASGAVLAPTVSVCQQCVQYGKRCADEIGDEDEGEDGKEEGTAEEEEKLENQIVPWSPPPPTVSASSGEESVSEDGGMTSRKRCRIQNPYSNPPSNDDHGCSSSENICTETPPSVSPANVTFSSLSKCQKTPLLKARRTDLGRVGSNGSGLLESLRRFHVEETVSSAELAIDLNYPDSS